MCMWDYADITMCIINTASLNFGGSLHTTWLVQLMHVWKLGIRHLGFGKMKSTRTNFVWYIGQLVLNGLLIELLFACCKSDCWGTCAVLYFYCTCWWHWSNLSTNFHVTSASSCLSFLGRHEMNAVVLGRSTCKLFTPRFPLWCFRNSDVALKILILVKE